MHPGLALPEASASNTLFLPRPAWAASALTPLLPAGWGNGSARALLPAPMALGSGHVMCWGPSQASTGGWPSPSFLQGCQDSRPGITSSERQCWGPLPSTSWGPPPQNTPALPRSSPSGSTRALAAGPGPVQAIRTEPWTGPGELWGPPVPAALCRLHCSSHGRMGPELGLGAGPGAMLVPTGGCSPPSCPLAPGCLYRPHHSV